MKPKLVFVGVAPVGTVQTSLAGWRGYSYHSRTCSDFRSIEAAECWVREEVYCTDDKGKRTKRNAYDPKSTPKLLFPLTRSAIP